MKPRLILVSLGLAVLTMLSFGLQAQEQPKTSSSQEERDNIITSQQQLARQWAEFQDALLRLKQRLGRGTPEEKKRAEVLGQVLEECKNLAINQDFTKMVEVLRLLKPSSIADVQDAAQRSEELSRKVSRILDLLRNTNTEHLAKEREALKKIIEDITKVIKQQQIVEAQTAQKITETKELAQNQNQVKEKTDKIAQDLGKYLDKDNKNPKGGEAAKPNGDNKEGKGGEAGKTKDAGKPGESAKGETKDGGKESQGAKGEAKAGEKANEGKKQPGENNPKADSKPGDKGKEGSPQAGNKENKSGAQGKEGSAKENKSGAQGKEGSAKDSGKPGEKKDGQQGAAKPGNDNKKPGGEQGKKSNAPDSQAKPGEKGPMDNKPASAKESKPGGDPKSGEAKPGGDPKSADSKQGDAKSGEAKSGQAKEGSPSKGDPQDSPPQAGQKGDGQPPQQQQPPGANKQNDDVAKSQKKVKEAGYDQQSAEEEIIKKNTEQALKKQADAIKNLEDAKKKLEKLLQQMREDELERVLAALQARCEKMLMMQMQVLAGTEDVHKAIGKNADKKATGPNKTESLKLSDQEKLIVQEANKCIDILEAEGSAVAFPEVFQQVRQDMIHVQKRLELTDVADQTQAIEKDIIATLKEMIAALKQAKQDMQQSDPKEGKPGKSGQPGDKKLLELIQELKMVRSMQKRVNDRTTDWGKNQEQANEPHVIRELRNLSDRQLRIQEIVRRIANGENK